MKYNFWFVVGSQDLYGEEVLKTVARRAAEMAAHMPAGPPPIITRSISLILLNLLRFLHVDKRFTTAFGNVLKGDVHFLCQQFYNVRGAEAALTASHAGSYSSLDRVKGSSRDKAVDGVDDLAFRYLFTTADDVAVCRIFLNQSISFFYGKVFWI